MVRKFERNPKAPAAEGIEGAHPPPIHLEDEPSEYRNDVSKIFVSLNNTRDQDAGGSRDVRRVKGNGGSTGSTGSSRTSGSGAGSGRGSESRGRSRSRGDRNGRKNEPESPRSQGALAEYFSSLFDESFCCHDFKLVGSRIFSSGKFQEEQDDTHPSGDPNGSSYFDRTYRDDSNHSTRGSGVSSGGSSAQITCEGFTSQQSDGEPWGWFDELEDEVGASCGGSGAAAPPVTKTTPAYILTESLSAQRLWRETAGRRPRQPSPERAYFEKQWNKNFTESEVDYSAHRQAAVAAANKRTRQTTKVLYRAASPFGSAVSKSFMCEKCGQITSIMVHIPKFQIVQTGSDVRAEYLIVVGLGTVTLGVWRRFSEFKRLAKKLSSSSRRDQFHNALCSWRCLRERQRWFRCLDKDYLILKTFLLERFLHDFVFESVSPNTVRDFLGVL